MHLTFLFEILHWFMFIHAYKPRTMLLVLSDLDSLLIDLKLTILFFISSRFIFFRKCRFVQSAWLFSTRFTGAKNTSNQICRIPVTVKNFATWANSLFLRASVSSVLNKESMAWLRQRRADFRIVFANLSSGRASNLWLQSGQVQGYNEKQFTGWKIKLEAVAF